MKFIEKEYLKTFIFKQKCVPNFIIRKWGRMAALLRDEFLPKEMIDLEETYINPLFCSFPHTREYSHYDQLEFIKIAEGVRHASLRLKHSPHVAFLMEFGDVPRIDETKFGKSDYYLMMLGCRSVRGTFFGIENITKLIEQGQYFLDLYRSFSMQQFEFNFNRHKNDGSNHSRSMHCKVLKLPKTNSYVISDGHHRLSAQYALGKRYAPAIVVGKDEFWLPKLGPCGVMVENDASFPGMRGKPSNDSPAPARLSLPGGQGKQKSLD